MRRLLSVAGHLTVSAVEIVQVVSMLKQLNDVDCPSLVLLVQEVGQFAQLVQIALRVLARQRFVGQPPDLALVVAWATA